MKLYWFQVAPNPTKVRLYIAEKRAGGATIDFESVIVKLPKGERSVLVHGHAWAGDHTVKALDLSIDFGATWIQAKLDSPANRYAWQNFSQTVKLPQEGYYEIWARATDNHGRMQPFAIAWNPKGYMNNSMHRISVYAS